MHKFLTSIRIITILSFLPLSMPLSLPQGLVFNLTLGADVLGNWTVYSLSIDEAVLKGLLSASSGFISTSSSFNTSAAPALSPPAFYAGSFIIPDGIPDLPQDTYIQFPNWRKVGVLTDSVVKLKCIYKRSD